MSTIIGWFKNITIINSTKVWSNHNYSEEVDHDTYYFIDNHFVTSIRNT